jgi:P4 family phage/plasmid primase-like protien
MIFAGERQLRGSGGGKEQEERMMMQKMEEGGAGAEVGALVGMLSASRAEEASSWQEVGRLLHGMSGGGDRWLWAWETFSRRRRGGYEEGECATRWVAMGEEKEGSSGGEETLRMWASEDSPTEYKRMVSARVFMEVRECNGTHNEVARIAHRMLSGRHVCATSNGKMWYVFDGTLWRVDDDAIAIRHELSTTVREQFIMAMSRVASSQTVDDMQSNASGSTANETRSTTSKLLKISFALQDASFKDKVMKEMREYFYDARFLRELDANKSLLAFTNGVWDLRKGAFRRGRPEDRLSLSTGYAYEAAEDAAAAAAVERYWRTLHPDASQREYVLRTFARQLYGDHGQELFHIHAGAMGTAANGKSKFFEVLEGSFGEYVCKFGVETLTAKQRVEAGKPMPELARWRGVRVLYCSEPNHEDKLNSGIMKELTGGEEIMYRLLFSNDVHKFRPQYKMHIMCNDAPQVDGSDSGVRRRIRKVDYVSLFVDATEADEAAHRYARDEGLMESFKGASMRMEFARSVLRHYQHGFGFEMPEVVRVNSRQYLEENDAVWKFVQECVEAADGAHFTLEEAKGMFKTREYYNRKPKTLKTDLEKTLRTACYAQKWVGGRNASSVFCGYRLRDREYEPADVDPLD